MTKPREYLFIGGDSDGVRMRLPEDVFRYVMPRRPRDLAVFQREPLGPMPDHEFYQRVNFDCGDGKIASFFLCLELTTEQGMQRLLEGYHR